MTNENITMTKEQFDAFVAQITEQAYAKATAMLQAQQPKTPNPMVVAAQQAVVHALTPTANPIVEAIAHLREQGTACYLNGQIKEGNEFYKQATDLETQHGITVKGKVMNGVFTVSEIAGTVATATGARAQHVGHVANDVVTTLGITTGRTVQALGNATADVAQGLVLGTATVLGSALEGTGRLFNALIAGK